MRRKETSSDFRWHFVIPMIAIVVLVVIIGLLPLFFHWLGIGGDDSKARLELLGTYGDMFGMLNATVSGLAFVAIYHTLRIQQKQHETQREELEHMKARAHLKIDRAKSLKVMKKRVRGARSGPDEGDKDKKEYLFFATYAKVVIENTSETVARNCLAVLTDIKEVHKIGATTSVEDYQAALRLRRSHGADFPAVAGGFDIPLGYPFHFDIFSLKDEDTAANEERTWRGGGIYTMLQVHTDFNRYYSYPNLLKINKTYMFEISITSDNADLLRLAIVVDIGDRLDSVKVTYAGKIPEDSAVHRDLVEA